MSDGNQINLNDRIKITPFLVPHRDEFSETVGYKIEGPKKSIIFIPDIDKWSKWGKDIVKIVDENDYALLDGSFFQNGEIPGRDMSEIPHPFIIESLKKLESSNKISKVYFIHLNHTNPALIKDSNAQQQIINAGFNIAEPKQIIAF
jgi:pyrroloquinoline quinone biosynthesis protein B